MTDPTIRLTVGQLRALVEPVIPLADKGDTVPVLTTVLIQSDGAYLYALATDRYRIGMQRVPVGDLPKGLKPFAIEVKHLRGIIALHKGDRHTNPEIVLTVGASSVSVEGGGSLGFLDSRTSWPRYVGEWPKVSGLFTSAVERAGKGTEATSLNAEYLASFRHAASAGEPIHVWTSETAATLIRVGDDFIGALMAVRSDRKIADRTTLDNGWSTILGVEPKAKKRAAAQTEAVPA